MKKLNKCLATLIGMSLVIGMMETLAFAGKKDLTPYEFTQLSPQEKVKYKTITIRFPSWLGGGDVSDIAREKEWKRFDEAYVSGDLKMPSNWYSKALFMLTHPKVKIESGILSWYWEEMMPAIAAGTASAIMPITWGGGPEVWLEKGLIADITDLVKDWDQTPYIMEHWGGYWKIGWLNGRCYNVPKGSAWYGAVVYRKDWFKEAGIFDEKGKPGVSWNWTWEDLREIAKKLTNKKKKHWGTSLCGVCPEMTTHIPTLVAASLGLIDNFQLVVPDRSGKYTWRFEAVPPIVKAYQYFQNMRWKDESLLFSPTARLWDPYNKDFMAGRIGLVLMIGTPENKGLTPSPFHPEHKYSEDVGIAPQPTSFSSRELGFFSMQADVDTWGFSAGLSKEELKAAFEYWDWISCGRGKTLELERAADLYPLIGKQTTVFYSINSPLFFAYKIRKVPRGLPTMEEMFGKEYAELVIPLREKYVTVAAKRPSPSDYGLKINMRAIPPSLFQYVQAAYQRIMSDANADVKTELEKVAPQINKECWNYKIKGDKEKFEKYYTAVADYLKEYAPEFYQSKKFKEMWEKYYKVW